MRAAPLHVAVLGVVGLGVVLGGGVGCGTADEPRGDAGVPELDAADGGSNEAPFPVEIGTGRETFVGLEDGDPAYLEAGYQGAQHVLVSVRAWELPEDRYLADFKLVRDDGLLLSQPSRVRVPFQAMAGGGGVELLGYQLVVGNDRLEDAVGATAVLSVSLTTEAGTAGDDRELAVALAPEDYDPDAE